MRVSILKRTFACALYLLPAVPATHAAFEPRLNEILASNGSVLADEDGEFSDWIEIQNTGDSAGNLGGWFITDDAGNLMRWTLPATPLAPGEFLIVFASSKDRAASGAELHTNFKLSSGGEYLALVQPDGTNVVSEFAPEYPEQAKDVSYGFSNLEAETVAVVGAQSPLRWHVPVDGSLTTSWTAVQFSDAGWTGTGTPGVGYEDSPGSTFDFTSLINSVLPSGTGNAYVRIPFEVTDAPSVSSMRLRVKYDDAYIAYLNGTEIYRTPNVPVSPGWNSEATSTHSDSLAVEFEVQDISAFASELNEGASNVLAFHMINRHGGGGPSTDFLLSPELLLTSATEVTSDLVYLQYPTPGSTNSPALFVAGPDVWDVTQDVPPQPSGQDLVIQGEVGASAVTVQLVYRINYDGEILTTMRDDGQVPDGIAGDGVHAGTIPASAFSAGDMIRWAVLATDDEGDLGTEPFRLDPLAPQYFGTVVGDEFSTAGARRFRWWVEDEAWYYTDGSTPIHKEYTGCSIYFDGEFYDNVRVRVRGASSVLLNSPVQSFHYNFHSTHRFKYFPDFKRIDRINVNWMFVDQVYVRNQLSLEAFTAAGVPGSATEMVTVELNGSYHNVGNIIEHPDEFLLERYGLDPAGALYKVYNRLVDATDRPIWTPGTSPNSLKGVEKKTRLSEDNSDLAAFIAGIDSSNPDRFRFAMDNLDMPTILNYMAAGVVDQGHDVFEKNNYVYRDTEGSGEWLMIPWDRDVSWGQGVWNRNSIEWDHASRSHPHYGSGTNNAASKDRYEMFEAIIDEPILREMFERRLRTVLDMQLQPPGTPTTNLFVEARLLELVASLDRVNPPGGEASNWIQHDKDLYGKLRGNQSSSALQTLDVAVNAITNLYLPNRRDYLFNTMGPSGEGIVPAAQTGNPDVRFADIDYSPSSGDQEEEYVAISNQNAFAVDISGWTISGGIEHTFKPGTVLPAKGGPLEPNRGKVYLSPKVSAFRARSASPTGGEGRFVQGNYKGQLSARGETVHLLNPNGVIVDQFTYAGAPTDSQDHLRISEIMYSPSAPMASELASQPYLAATDFEFIELVNTGTSPIDLGGAQFTDGVLFTFPVGFSLPAGGYAIVAANTNAFPVRYGSSAIVAGQFDGNLNNNSETIILRDSVGEKVLDFTYNDSWHRITDSHDFSLVVNDVNADWTSWDVSDSWRSSANRLGSPGAADPTPSAIGNVLINEVLAHTDGITDTIELYNPEGYSVDIGGWFLTDDFDNPYKFRIPYGTILPSGGFTIYDEGDFNTPTNLPTSFQLSSVGDEAWIFSANAQSNLTGYVHGFSLSASQNGVSFGRHMTSIGEEHFPAQSTLSLETANAGPKVGPIVISEIMYHPADLAATNNLRDEYIELTNISGGDINLYDSAAPTNTWRVRNAVDFDFPQSVSMAAGNRILLVGFDPADTTTLASFRAAFGVDPGVPIYGPWSGALNNAGDDIELKWPDNPNLDGSVPYILAEEVGYETALPWHPEAGGTGSVLQRVDSTAYGDDPANWTAAESSPGTAFVSLVKVEVGDLIAGDGITLSWETVSGESYGVETNADLINGSWGSFTSSIPGDGGTLTFTNTIDATELFFRVVVE